MSEHTPPCDCPRIDGYVIRRQGCTHTVHRPKPAVTPAPAVEPQCADDGLDAACAWADYRKDYGVSAADMRAAHKAFLAGWLAARSGDQSGALR